MLNKTGKYQKNAGNNLKNNVKTYVNLYYYGARFYDPVIGRFTTQDRFAEKYYSFTPYHYAMNNPICNIDINGDSTLYYGSNGDLLHVGYDSWKNAVVFVSDDRLDRFNSILSKNSDNIDSKKISGRLRAQSSATYDLDAIKVFESENRDVALTQSGYWSETGVENLYKDSEGYIYPAGTVYRGNGTVGGVTYDEKHKVGSIDVRSNSTKLGSDIHSHNEASRQNGTGGAQYYPSDSDYDYSGDGTRSIVSTNKYIYFINGDKSTRAVVPTNNSFTTINKNNYQTYKNNSFK